jgi:urease accessory protein
MSVSASIALLQLASPALPIGGYSYSTALEWGVDGGAVRDEAGAREWIADALGLSIAARETAELRLESEQMGYSLGRWLEAVCPEPDADAWIAARLSPLALPVGWAIAATRLGLAERDALLGLFWAFAENQAMVLMKAVPMGQIAAQRLLRSLAPELEAAVGRALALPREAWSSAAPGLAIASARHETQYSRLFRS